MSQKNRMLEILRSRLNNNNNVEMSASQGVNEGDGMKKKDEEETG